MNHILVYESIPYGSPTFRVDCGRSRVSAFLTEYSARDDDQGEGRFLFFTPSLDAHRPGGPSGAVPVLVIHAVAGVAGQGDAAATGQGDDKFV